MLAWMWQLFTHRHEYGDEFLLAGQVVRKCEVCPHVLLVQASMKEDRWRHDLERSVDEPLDELEPIV
jgi:hypothetical protein